MNKHAKVGKAAGLHAHKARSAKQWLVRAKVFLTNLKDFIMSVEGVVAAVTALVGGLFTLWLIFRPAVVPPKTPTGTPPPPVDVKMVYPKVYPVRFQRYDPPYPKWFQITVQNLRDESLIVRVFFKVNEGPAKLYNKESAGWTLGARERRSENVRPVIELEQTFSRGNDKLTLICDVVDHKDNSVWTGTANIDLLPDNVIDWQITTPDGKKVPLEFLVAFLTTWTVAETPSRVKTYAEKLRDLHPRVDEASTWFAHAYARLFQEIQVSDGPMVFPAEGRQTIQTPDQVLTKRNANPLEAALLLGALSRIAFDNKVRVVLFAIPDSESETVQKRILLSWSSMQGWHAVSLAEANKYSFEENEKEFSPRLVELLTKHPDILTALDRGVFLREAPSVIALDFVRADRQYHLTTWGD
jgi:hypothetical protein